MFFEKLARLWSVDESLPSRVDVIALVSFGATKDGLTKGAQVTLRKALDLAARYPGARVAFGVFTLSPCPRLEECLKRQSFKDPIFAGEVVSTIEEAEKIQASLPPEIIPLSFIVVTDEWHSRSAKTIWKRIWQDAIPKPDIRVIVVPSSEVIDEENPMKALRSHWTWALVNVLRQIFLVCVPGGFKLLKKLNLHQPT